MASLEYIEKTLSNKKANLEKLNKKMERILKAKESNYELNNPYYYSDYDLRVTTRDIELTEKSIADLEEKLKSEIEKANSRDVKVIIDFLDAWKSRVFDYYLNDKNGLKAYYKEDAEIKQLMEQERQAQGTKYLFDIPEEIDKKRKAFFKKCRGYYQAIPKDSPKYKSWHTEEKVKDGEYEWLGEITSRCNTEQEATAYLTKILDQEANAKYDDIINRTNKIVGQITDASGLTIGAKGDLNGIIVGTSGKASVTTIGAGGYNIQIFHFRTLIKPLK